MTLEPTTLLWGAPLLMLLGGYGLIHCIGRLRRIIFPDVRQRWSDAARPQVIALPRAGRYVINIVFPAFTVVTGTAHFAADFAITRLPGQPVPYQRYSRFRLFSVRRSDMGGNSSNPLGEFTCSEPGDYQITCLTPDHIRPGFQLEVSPYVSPASFVPLILGTILSAAMTIGGLVFTLLKLTGRL
ncbi:hypothetical protein N5J43_24560 [Pseudomonas nicosulfuronedens]|uniref:hypothetical protein n=1 Tax=Pseudomonas nicosulfuronedens TaxID=2571105 RepID=UPI00244C9275|nr:hypothetical protein [Pseudomonas nicosulfuronedens]MDH1011363.1 hypothetical protein [Pseudomonas nicosulfuronedens]MDH1982138.1 hypothetical protein [Pseudomonas nicosulfuronedens]MDH2029685.1 hypothetical protein [Pseudomonas nicosulfuronedens]